MEYNTPVIVPDVGCFTIVNKPSENRDGTIIPPVKTVELDIYNKTDDNVLTLYISQKANMSMEEAGEAVQKFYSQYFMLQLTLEKYVAFEKFGSFSMNEYGNITFEPDASFFKDNYGLGNAFVQGNAPPQPVEAEFTTIPQPPPSFEPKNEQPEPEDTLFDSNNSRFRENTERRRPVAETPPPVRPPVRPNRPAKTPPPKKQKQPKQKKTNGSYLWLLWVLLIAVGFGFAGYFLYPVIYKIFFPPITTINMIVEEEALASDEETEIDTTNTEIAQTLDDATDKKNALNPEESQQTVTSTSQPQAVPSTSRTEPSQGSVSGGKYVLIIGSFTTHAQAERFGRTLQANGIDYEIVDAGNQRFRISVASYDNMAEATRQANLMKSKPYCENVWVARR